MEGIHIEFNISEEDKAKLQKEIAENIDAATLQRMRDLVRGGEFTCPTSSITPFPGVVYLESASESDKKEWNTTGLNLIASGKVAVLLLAGGQGSRLGYDHPKGMYSLGLLSKKSLFEIQANRILSVQRLAKAQFPGASPKAAGELVDWYIMTSDATDDETRAFFAEKEFFGIPQSKVHFFRQGMLPALNSKGEMLLERPDKIALSPNGNAGVYQGLVKSGALDEMKAAGVEIIYQYGVDNVLAQVCDPTFIGFVYKSGADCASKGVAKAYPDERVGSFCMRDGKYGVVEYTEISDEARHMVDPETGKLSFGASHICVNAFSLDFLLRCALSPLPFHLAHKKVPYVGAEGKIVEPEEPNAYKAEMFIFDMFAYADKMVILLAQRAQEFSPLKNPPGSKTDCPETSRRDLYALHKAWLESAGATLDNSESDDVEISPFVSYAGEGLEFVKGSCFLLPCYLSEELKARMTGEK